MLAREADSAVAATQRGMFIMDCRFDGQAPPRSGSVALRDQGLSCLRVGSASGSGGGCGLRIEPDFLGPLDLHHATFVDHDLHDSEPERSDLFAQGDKPVRLASGCGSEGGRIRRVEVRLGHDECE